MADQSKSSCASRRDDIPIAIDTEVVMKLWLNEKYVNNLPRTIRFTVYLKILDLLADMLSCAYSARFDKENRKTHLDKYINDLQYAQVRTTRRLRQYTRNGQLIAEWFPMFEDLERTGIKTYRI